MSTESPKDPNSKKTTPKVKQSTDNTKQSTNIESKQATARYRKPNYNKYEEKKEQMRDVLSTDVTSSEAAKKLQLSPSTLFKYKTILSYEDGRPYMTKDEQAYLNSRKGRKHNPPNDPESEGQPIP